MARAAGATAASSQGSRGVTLLELSASDCVSTTEVGGLLKKGGLRWI